VRPIYFDYNATTPPDPEVIEVMKTAALRFANPSSIHHAGRQARALLDDARERMAAYWRCRPAEVVFTASATEANNLAILGVARRRRDRGRHLVVSAIEHPAVLRTAGHLAAREGFEVTQVRPDAMGEVDPASVESALRPDTILVSVMAANNEFGSLQPVRDIGLICRRHSIPFHTDAVQWYGKETFQTPDEFAADLVTLSGHKFHGPKGSAALFVRGGLDPEPLVFGGPQEHDRRAGTENVPAILGLVLAVERFALQAVFCRAQIDPLRADLRRSVEAIPGTTVHGHPTRCLCNTLAASFAGCDTLSVLAGLDLEGICVSGGSACSAGSIDLSPVLQAIGAPNDRETAMVRFSLGRESTAEEVTVVGEALRRVIGRIRAVGQSGNNP
jgi:cysteine desulfurase